MKQGKEFIIQYIKDHPKVLNQTFPPFPPDEDPDGTEYQEFLEMIYSIGNWDLLNIYYPNTPIATQIFDEIPEGVERMLEYGCFPLEGQLNYTVYEMNDGSFTFGEYTGD